MTEITQTESEAGMRRCFDEVCSLLEKLRLHAVNCREAQRNFKQWGTVKGECAKDKAEELLDKLLEEIKP